MLGETLNRLAALLTSLPSLFRLCEFVVQETTRLLDATVAGLWLEAGGEGAVVLSGSHGTGHAEARGRDRFGPGEGLVGWVAQTRQPLVVADVLADSRTVDRDWFQAEGLRTFAGVPLLVGEHCIGVLCAMHANRPFDRAGVGLGTAFAAKIAPVIQDVFLYENAEREGGRLGALLEAMPAGILVAEGRPATRTLRFTMANRAWEALMPGWTLVPGARKPGVDLLRSDGSPLTDEELPLQRAVWKGEATRDMEIGVRFPDGGQKVFLANAVPLPAAGKERQAVAVYLDITERKQAETELQRLAAENEALYRRATREARVRGTLLEELNHRVRNSMGLISSLLELERGACTESRIGEALEQIIDRVQGVALVYSVLAGAQFASDGLPRLIRELAGRILQDGPLAGRVEVHVGTLPTRLSSAELTHLGIILNELFTNIVKHAFPGGRRGVVRIEGETVGSAEAVLRVSDTGVGLSTAEPPVGLGFRLVRSIVEASLQGAFTIEGGEGMTAIVRFPLQAEGSLH